MYELGRPPGQTDQEALGCELGSPWALSLRGPRKRAVQARAGSFRVRSPGAPGKVSGKGPRGRKEPIQGSRFMGNFSCGFLVAPLKLCQVVRCWRATCVSFRMPASTLII